MADAVQLEDDLDYGRYKPVTPKLFTGMMWVWSPPVSGIGLALNWRGLGKPGWILPTLLLSLIIPLVTFGLPLFIASRFPAITQLAGCLLPTILGINYGYIAGLAEFQRDAYKKWYAGNEEGMLKHLYSLNPALWKAAIWTIGFHVVMWAVVIIIMIITLITQGTL
jgi:hypothetical protein